jgi:hypothetical protein
MLAGLSPDAAFTFRAVQSVPGPGTVRTGICRARGLVAGLFSLALWIHSAQAKTGLEGPMVLTQVPGSVAGPPAGWDTNALTRSDWYEGARLVIVSPEGQVRVLSDGFNSACDPSLAFDAKRLLFAGKKDRLAPWRIWEVNLDGSGLRPVSPETQDARNPIYATTLFTLDSPEPWFTLVYSAQEKTLNEMGRAGASSLYNVKLDGTELRRLTFNPNHNLDPYQMWDGRVIYAAERYPNLPGAQEGRVGLYAIHVEGADMELYGGELGGSNQQMPCATPSGLVVFVESSRGAWDGAGQLACVEQRRPHVTYRRLTEDTAHVYLHPSPLAGNRVLVSRRTTDGKSTCGIIAYDADRRQSEPVFDTSEYHEVQALFIQPRPQPDGHSTVVNPKLNTGTFYGLNSLDADPKLAPHLRSGMVKQVRLIEGIPQPAMKSPAAAAPGQSFVPRRLVGEAPVEADGSFNVEVPADTPLLLQTLDERGLALANCGWIWVKPKESRGCIGCHEDPERIPENEYVLALRRPSNQLTLAPDQRRTLSFRHDIAPLLQSRCATSGCHGGNDTPWSWPAESGNRTEQDLQLCYRTLLAPLQNGPSSAAAPPVGKYIDAGRARTSWLVWQLLGTNASRPWDLGSKPSDPPARKISRMPPQQHRPLSEIEIRTIIQWIDMGAPFEAVPSDVSPAADQPESRK